MSRETANLEFMGLKNDWTLVFRATASKFSVYIVRTMKDYVFLARCEHEAVLRALIRCRPPFCKIS